MCYNSEHGDFSVVSFVTHTHMCNRSHFSSTTHGGHWNARMRHWSWQWRWSKLEHKWSRLEKSWWRHQMETFSALLVFVRGIHRSPVNSPHTGQCRGALMFRLICALNKRLSKQSWGWWFEMPSRSLWRHCNETFWYWCRVKRGFSNTLLTG